MRGRRIREKDGLKAVRESQGARKGPETLHAAVLLDSNGRPCRVAGPFLSKEAGESWERGRPGDEREWWVVPLFVPPEEAAALVAALGEAHKAKKGVS